jgi:PAS domain S-box-containing protein
MSQPPDKTPPDDLFRHLAESIPQLVWTTTPDGWHDYFNSRWFDFTGMSLEQSQGWEWSNLLHPDDRERTLEVWKYSLRTGAPYEIEYRFRNGRTGEYRWFLGRALPQFDADDRIVRWFGTCTDIQDQKQTEYQRDQLLKEAEARASREALLNRIGQAQRFSDDPLYVQQIAVMALGEALGAERCYFVRYELERDRTTVSHDWHVPGIPSLVGVYHPKAMGFDMNTLHREGVTMALNDIRTSNLSELFKASFAASNFRSVVTVPMYENGVLSAALTVAMANAPRTWKPEEIALIEAAAAQTRTSMDLAALMQREHNIAERLQDALRPTLSESVPGLDLAFHYAAALAEASVGGDFFDVFTVEGGCVALVIGDLSGKGLDAASQISTVRNMLRFALYRGQTAAEAVQELNNTLSEHGLLTGFATLFVGLYDRQKGNLTFVSCGHEPAFIRRVDTGTVAELPPTGPVLGVFAGAKYDEEVVNLSVGDMLVLYTDGLSEAGRARHEFLGPRGMQLLVQGAPKGSDSSHLVTHIVQGVTEHARGQFHDDQCLLTAVVEPLEKIGSGFGPINDPA